MKQLVILLFSFSLLRAGPGFFEQSFKPRRFQRPEKRTKGTTPSGDVSVTITVFPEDTVQKIVPTLFGNNANSVMGAALLSDDLYGLTHMRRANIRTLRLPGGTWSNQWLWDGVNHWGEDLHEHYVDSAVMSLPTHSWNYNTDDLLTLCRVSGARPQICVNFALARYIDAPDAVEQAAHYAAEWVRDVNVQKGLGVTYWEVGNENYGDWEKGFVVNGDTISAEFYGKAFCVFADSMKAADSSIKVGAVVLGANEWSFLPDWTETVIKKVQNHADYLVIHDYFNWKADANAVTETEVLNGLSQIGENSVYLDQCIAAYTDLKESLPVAMTEFNIFAGRKNSSFLGGIFLSRALGEFITHGYGLANFWGTVGGWDSAGNDMGMLSRNEPGVRDYTPHASFFPYYYYERTFGDYLVKAQSSKRDVTVYASLFASGHMGLVIANSGAVDEVVLLESEHFAFGERAFLYMLDADSLSARTFRINGIAPESGLHGPLGYDTIAAVELPVEGALKLTAPRYSMTYLVIEPKELAVQEVTVDTESPFCLIPRRGELHLYLHNSLKNPTIHLYNLRGELFYTGRTTGPSAGKQRIPLPNSLAEGIYLLQLSVGNQRWCRKFKL